MAELANTYNSKFLQEKVDTHQQQQGCLIVTKLILEPFQFRQTPVFNLYDCMFRTQFGCDIQFKFGDGENRELFVHRFILVARAPTMIEKLKIPVTTSSAFKGKPAVIKLKDYNYNVFLDFLYYVYTGLTNQCPPMLSAFWKWPPNSSYTS